MAPKLNRKGYKELRDDAYKSMGIIANAATKFDSQRLEAAYNQMCAGLDEIDGYGYDLGFLDPETNEYTEEE